MPLGDFFFFWVILHNLQVSWPQCGPFSFSKIPQCKSSGFALLEMQTHLFTSAVCIKPDVMCIVPNVLKGIAVNVLQEDNKYPASSQLIYLLHSHQCPSSLLPWVHSLFSPPLDIHFSLGAVKQVEPAHCKQAKVQQAGVYVSFLSFD